MSIIGRRALLSIRQGSGRKVNNQITDTPGVISFYLCQWFTWHFTNILSCDCCSITMSSPTRGFFLCNAEIRVFWTELDFRLIDCCNDIPGPVICTLSFPTMQLPPRTWSETHLWWALLPLLLSYSSIIPCSNHLNIPKMVIEVKRSHTDNLLTHSAVSGSYSSENRILREFTTLLFLTLSSVIVDISFWRLISMWSSRQLCVMFYDDTLRFTWQKSTQKWGPCSVWSFLLCDKVFPRVQR